MHTCSRCPALPVCYFLPALGLLVHTPIEYKTQIPAPQSCRTAPCRQDTVRRAQHERTASHSRRTQHVHACHVIGCGNRRLQRQEPAPTCLLTSAQDSSMSSSAQHTRAQPACVRATVSPQRAHGNEKHPIAQCTRRLRPRSRRECWLEQRSKAQLTDTWRRRQTRRARDRSACKSARLHPLPGCTAADTAGRQR